MPGSLSLAHTQIHRVTRTQTTKSMGIAYFTWNANPMLKLRSKLKVEVAQDSFAARFHTKPAQLYRSTLTFQHLIRNPSEIGCISLPPLSLSLLLTDGKSEQQSVDINWSWTFQKQQKRQISHHRMINKSQRQYSLGNMTSKAWEGGKRRRRRNLRGLRGWGPRRKRRGRKSQKWWFHHGNCFNNSLIDVVVRARKRLLTSCGKNNSMTL